MKKALLVMDLEKAFINQYTNELPDKVEEYIASSYYDHIVVGKFVNHLDSIFVKRLGENKCLDKEDCMLMVHPSKAYEVMERTAYTMYTEELESYLKSNKIKYVYLCGVDTDRSIYKTALDLIERGYYVYIIKNLCGSSAGTTCHDMAIRLLERLIGKDYII